MAMTQLRCLVTLLVLAAYGHGESGSAQRSVEAQEQWALPREGASGLDLRTQAGSIHVIGADEDKLQVHAIKSARADREEEAQAFLRDMKLERRRGGDHRGVEATGP